MDTPETLKPIESIKSFTIGCIQEDLSKLHNAGLDPQEASNLYTSIQHNLDQLRQQELVRNRLTDFVQRIKEMNIAFQPVTCYNTRLTNLGEDRIEQLVKILGNEMLELQEVYQHGDIDFTALADCLGDLVVYIFSEAARWGIPLLEVLYFIMDSQASKLVNGKPIPHSTEPGKFGKGPNYFPPEDRIRDLLEYYK